MRTQHSLIAIKLAHTIVWAFMVLCIAAVPLAAWLGRFDWAAVLTTFVLLECVVLALNKGRCPLTNLAARYTDERADNFDIYLPLLVARHNKAIFGALFLCGELFALYRWLGCTR